MEKRKWGRSRDTSLPERKEVAYWNDGPMTPLKTKRKSFRVPWYMIILALMAGAVYYYLP